MNDNHQHADTNMNESDGECRECRRYARDLAARRRRITELESKLSRYAKLEAACREWKPIYESLGNDEPDDPITWALKELDALEQKP